MLKELFLETPRLTLGVAESLTGGRVQARIAAVSGASEFFLGGITAYTLTQKQRHLGVDPTMAAAVNSVSAEVARQMARGACALFGADLGVATTGYAEAAPMLGVFVPCAYWAVCHRLSDNATINREGFREFPGRLRVEVQEAVAALLCEELAAHLSAWRIPTRR